MSHIWMGVSVECRDYVYRIDRLRKTRARVKFLSLEPLLGPLPDLELEGIDWVIVGGESGPHARSMEKWWVEEIRDRCLDSAVPFFFKQWGVARPGGQALLDGAQHHNWPDYQRISTYESGVINELSTE